MRLILFLSLVSLACVSQTAITRHEQVQTTTPVFYVCRTEQGLNVRSAPGFGNPIVATLSEGSEVKLTGHSAFPVAVEWYEIEGGWWVNSKWICER